MAFKGHSNLLMFKKKFPVEEFIFNVDRKVLDELISCQVKKIQKFVVFMKTVKRV